MFFGARKMEVEEIKRFIQIELDRLGPCVKDECSAIEVKTLERVLWFINGNLRVVKAGQTPEHLESKHAKVVAKEVARIKEDWLRKLGVTEQNRHCCKIVEFERKDEPGRLIYQLYVNDLPQDELIIDLEIMGTERRRLR